MAHPFASKASASSRTRLRGRVDGKNSGGGGNAYSGGSSFKRYSPKGGEVGSYDSHEKTFAVGGVTGGKTKSRGDRFANGGKVASKKKGNVNIVIHTGQKQPPAPMMPPMPPPGPPPGGPPGGGGAPPPGGPPGGMPPMGGMAGGMNPMAMQALAGLAGGGGPMGGGAPPGGVPGMPPKPPGVMARGGKVQKKQGGGPAGVAPGLLARPSMAPAMPAQSTAGAMPALGGNVAGGPANTATMPPNLLGAKRGGNIKPIKKAGGGPTAFPGGAAGGFPGQGAPVAGGWPGLQGAVGDGGGGQGGGGGWAAQPNVGAWTPGAGMPPWAQGGGGGGDHGGGWAAHPGVGSWTPGAGKPPWAGGGGQGGPEITPPTPVPPIPGPSDNASPMAQGNPNDVRIFKRGGRAKGGRTKKWPDVLSSASSRNPEIAIGGHGTGVPIGKPFPPPARGPLDKEEKRGGRAKRARGGRRR